MPIESVSDLSDALRHHRLLEPAQVDQLAAIQARFKDAKALARALLQRDWLTAYQANQLLQGHGADLVMGQYVVLERLGEGGMGTVFKARQRRLKRLAALKVIRKENLAAAGAIQRFHREAEAAARLAHPNIVAVYDADEANGTHFLAMEYIEGIDLARMVRERGPLPVDEACEYIRQAALGLQHAHEAGLIHRDIKPGNLLVTRRASSLACPPATRASKAACPTDQVVKILDMGLARVVRTDGDEESSGALTQDGVIMGTLDYLAPEQAEDSHHVDGRADLYSLGCTFYCLLTGKPPFPGGSAPEKLMKHRLDEPVPVDKLRPEVPAEVAAVIKKLLAKKPDDRYQTAADVTAVLGTQQWPVPTPARPSRGPQQQTAREPMTEGAVSVALTAGLPAGQDQAAEEDRSSETASELEAPAEPATAAGLALPQHPMLAGRKRRGLLLAAAVLLLGGAAVPLLWRGSEKPNTGRQPAPINTPPPMPVVQKPPDEEKAWKLGPADNVLRGLVPRPALFAGVKRWQLETAAPRGEVWSVAWNPKAPLLACGTNSGEVRVYDTETLQLVRLLIGHTDRVKSVAWSPDGQRLASAGYDRTVRLWAANGTPGAILKAGPPWIFSVAWSPDGRRLAAANAQLVRLWDVDGTPEPALKGHTGNIRSVTWSPDGKRLASASDDQTVRLWQADSTPGPILKGHSSAIWSVAWSPDNKNLASASLDGTVRLWQVDGTPGPVLRGHPSGVHSVAWRPDGKRLASSGHEKMVRLWDADGTPGLVLQADIGEVGSVAWSPDGRRLAAGGDLGVRLCSADGKDGSVLIGRKPRVNAVAWSRDGQRLASGGEDKLLRLWSVNGTPGPICKGHKGTVFCVGWSPDGKRLASGDSSVEVRLWTADGKQGPVLRPRTNGVVMSVAWSADGNHLASGSLGGIVCLWRADGKAGPDLKGHTSYANSVAWSPDSQRLASGSQDSTVRLWSADGKEGPVLKVTPGTAVYSVAWCPIGQLLASGGSDTTVRLWSADGKEGPLLRGHTLSVNSVAWSADGKRLASAGDDQTVRLWQVDGKPGPILKGHTASVRSVSWSSGGRIASCGDDATIRLWDAASAEPREVIVRLRDHQSATFSAAGQLRHGDPAVIEKAFVYVVEQNDGRLELLQPSEFLKRYAAGR